MRKEKKQKNPTPLQAHPSGHIPGLRWALALLSLLLLAPSIANAVKFRYPLTKPSTWTTYIDHNRSASGMIDWHGGKFTYNGHTGTDFARPKGSRIVAAADGRVIEVIDGMFDDCRDHMIGKKPCEGPSNRVRIRHSDGRETSYLHMKKFSIVVKKGAKVKCGQKIGQVGSSGRSTGNHLHFHVGAILGGKEPFKGPRGAKFSMWTSQGPYGRAGRVPGSKCDGTKPECTQKADCKDPQKPICTNGKCVPKPPPGCAYVKTTRLSGKSLNMRAQSNTNASVVGSIPEGVCLDVIKQAQGQDVKGKKTWYQVKYSGSIGWISAAYADCSTCGGVCRNGATQSCYSGPANTANQGICKEGTKTCTNGKWGKCQGEQVPQNEACDNQIDDNCDGTINENCPSVCTEGESRDCETQDQGHCKAGSQLCAGGAWGFCESKLPPQAEICNGKDDDCDGSVDEKCPSDGTCLDNDKDGHGRGANCPGKQDCDDDDKDVHPAAREICHNLKDDNCDGIVDEHCEGPPPGCDDKDKDGAKVGGECPEDTPVDCDDNNKEISPTAKEICGNGIDEDCSGADLPCPTPELAPQEAIPDQATPQEVIQRDNAQPESPIAIGCRNDRDCKVGMACIKSQCQPRAPSGCNCSAYDPSAPFLSLLLLFGLWLLRRPKTNMPT